MVSDVTRTGLIVSPAGRASDLLDELIAATEWPVLLEPSVRLLFQQIEVTSPQCLLFWFDESHEIESTLKLIARLRDRGSRPYRVAVTHQLSTDAEPAIRAAGVQPADLSAILLAGGSSRIPLIGQLLATAFDRPVVADPHPEHSIAMGAAVASATGSPPSRLIRLMLPSGLPLG